MERKTCGGIYPPMGPSCGRVDNSNKDGTKKKCELVLLYFLNKRVSIFDCIFRVGCLDPANRDHGIKLTPFLYMIIFMAFALFHFLIVLF